MKRRALTLLILGILSCGEGEKEIHRKQLTEAQEICHEAKSGLTVHQGTTYLGTISFAPAPTLDLTGKCRIAIEKKDGEGTLLVTALVPAELTWQLVKGPDGQCRYKDTVTIRVEGDVDGKISVFEEKLTPLSGGC